MNLQETAKYLEDLGEALKRGTERFIGAVPVLTRQTMERLASQKLHSTKETYLDALNINVDSNILIVTLDEDSWLANAVETGVDGWDMKTTHLRSPKAKISAKGYKYLRIPIGKTKDGSGGPSAKGQELQEKIRKVLMGKPAFGAMKTKTLTDGRVVEQQKLLIESDPALKGFYRMRSYTDFNDYHANKGKRKSWQYVLFRTMTNNPEARSKWEHPGIKPAHIFRDTERWLTESIPAIAESIYGAEIEALNKKYGGS